MSTFRIFLLELQNPTLFPYVKTAKTYPKTKQDKSVWKKPFEQ